MPTGILSPTHLLIVLVVALVFLGPKRLPGAGKALGQGLREFKDSISGHTDDSDSGQPVAGLLGGSETSMMHGPAREPAVSQTPAGAPAATPVATAELA